MIISEDSKKARRKVMEILDNRRFNVSNEDTTITFQCRRGKHELINPPYKTDLHVSKTFLIEFDSFDAEGEVERDSNIWEQYHIKTVRLPSEKVIHAEPDAILREIEKQLSDKERYPEEYTGPTCNHCKRPITWNHPETGKTIPHPQTGNPQPLEIETGEVHHCMEEGTKDGAYYKGGKIYYNE